MIEINHDNQDTKLPFKKSHAFIIGINNYSYIIQLRTAVKDAEKIAEVLAEEQRFTVHPPLLNADYSEIMYLLKETIPGKVGENDRVFFYFAGHGISAEGENKPGGYIVPLDAQRFSRKNLISMNELYKALHELPCRHLLLVLDCCFAGTFKWASPYRYAGVFAPKLISRERFECYAGDPAWQVITSAAHDQRALDVLEEKPIGKRDDETMKHSPFAEALFKGLSGAADIIPADGGDGVITATELYLYIRLQVEHRTINKDDIPRQTPGIFPLEKHDKGEFIFLNPKHRLNLPSIPKRNPYKGLLSFEEKDSDLFYGRERVIKDLSEKVEERNLIVVSGASGTGKSSVVKAGLIPELRKQDYRILPVIRPGKMPVTALERALNESNLFAGNVNLYENKVAVSQKLTENKTVLVIDQFEELITRCKNEEIKNRFIEILKSFLDIKGKNLLKIILTLRADFEPRFKDSELDPYWQKGRYTVPPFSPEELREIIVKPTIQEVLYIEPGELVDQIIDDVIQWPGALPLLSFTLSEMYCLYIKSKRTDRVLHKDDYDKLRGVSGALQNRADTIYNDLDAEHKDTMKKIMLRMVALEGSEPTGKRVLSQDLNFSKLENKRVETIIDRLVETRLLRRGKDDSDQIYIEPAHDALIKAWGALLDWIRERGEDKIFLQDRLDDAVKDYKTINDKNLLWHDDPRLDLLKAELKNRCSWLNNSEVDFIKESIELKELERKKSITRLTSVIITLTILLSLAISLGIRANREAKIARANYYTTLAQLKLDKNDPVTAIRCAEKAYYLHKTKETMQVLSAAAATTSDRPFYNSELQHKRAVNDVEFSPDGARILTASSDKTAGLWDIHGKLLATLPHQGVVYSARFSPQGSEILTHSRENSARLWDLQGNCLASFQHEDIVSSARFSSDGRSVLTASEDFTAKLWSLQGTPKVTFTGHTDMINFALFSPGGRKILTASRDKTAKLYDLHGNILADYKHKDTITTALFTPDGRSILTASRLDNLTLWNLKGEMVTHFHLHKDMVNFARFSADGRILFTAYHGGKVLLWKPDGSLIAKFDKHNGPVYNAVFSPSGKKILTASGDFTAKLWDLEGNVLADINKHKKMVTDAAFSSDGSKILTASRDNTAKLWDLHNQPTTEINFRRIGVSAALFSPGGSRILILSDDRILQLTDLYGNITATINGHKKMINSAAFSPDSAKILTASADKTAKLWNINGNPLKDFTEHTANVNSAVFSPDGTKILTASFDGTAKLWDLQGNLLANLDQHTAAVNSAIFSPGGDKILTASFDKTAKLWDLAGKLLLNLTSHSSPVTAVEFSPDGAKVLTVSVIARLWNIKSHRMMKLERPIGPEYRAGVQDRSINSAHFSPDGRKVLTASNDNTIQLWSLNGDLLVQFDAHKAIIYSALFSPNGSRLLTASADKTVKLWDLQGNMLADFDRHKGVIRSAVFSPDGSRVLSAAADGTVKLRHTPGAIIRWLRTAGIPRLPREIKKK